MLNKYRNAHFERIIETTNNLFLKSKSICHKCHYVQGTLNCLFCYCPIYDDCDCGGEYIILNNGIKDCSKCLKPHTKEFIIAQLIKLYDN